ncbi:MAG: hypothetical protein ACTHOO_12390 [Alcanivorax sp.]
MVTFFVCLNVSSAHAADEYDATFFQTKMPAELKEKMRQSEFYKTLVSLGSQKPDSIRSNPIHILHGRLYEEAFGAIQADSPKFMQALIYLEDVMQNPYGNENFNSYFFDWQATAFLKMAAISKLAKAKTEQDRLYKEKEIRRLTKAAMIRVAQWKILAEEDTRKCKNKEEALAFFKANAAKYAFQEDAFTVTSRDELNQIALQASDAYKNRPAKHVFQEDAFTVIGRDELNQIALQASDAYKNRPANMHLCEMSKQYRDRLKETGTAVYATKQSDGKVLIHIESAETPIKENSTKLDMYINTGQIEPEYIHEKDWLLIRQKIRSGFAEAALSEPVIR